MWQAVFIMFVAMSMIPAGDVAGKVLTANGTAPGFVAWSRFAFGALMIAPFVPRRAWRLLGDWRIWLRACCLGVGVFCIQTALKTEPLADVFAAFFIGPILSYALSAALLREPTGWRRNTLMLIGFIGVLLVVRPGFGGSANLLWAVLAGSCYGAFLTASRWLAGLGTALELNLSQLVISALILAPIGLANLPDVTLQVGALTLASAAFSMMGNLLLMIAYGRAAATQLAPLVYFQLIAATGLGWMVFADLPDGLTWLGLALVIGAGLTSAALRR
ncbi:MAG: DMT family transporter [Sedimentitalea sp.]